jgi:hypothetical protein
MNDLRGILGKIDETLSIQVYLSSPASAASPTIRLTFLSAPSAFPLFR